MMALNCSSIQDYLHRIDADPTAWAQCEQHLTITISRFFRDRRFWDQAQQRILPALWNRFGGRLRAWSAGCANGEEPCSLAIVALAAVEATSCINAIKILATDVDVACLQRARQGRYPESSLKEVPQKFRQQWFHHAGRQAWQIDEQINACIHWQHHELLSEPPQNCFHMILLRNNLLTYYQGLRLQTAFRRIVDHLEIGGALIVGSHETLPPESRSLKQDSLCPWAYWKRY